MNDDLIHIIALKDNRIYDLQKALEWYADKKNHYIGYDQDKQTPFAAIDEDAGERARTALQSIQGGDKE